MIALSTFQRALSLVSPAVLIILLYTVMLFVGALFPQ